MLRLAVFLVLCCGFCHFALCDWAYSYGLHHLDMMSQDHHTEWSGIACAQRVANGELLAQFNNTAMQTSIQFYKMSSHIMIVAHSSPWSIDEINMHMCNASLRMMHGEQDREVKEESVGYHWYGLYKTSASEAMSFYTNMIHGNYLYLKYPVVILGYQVGGTIAQLMAYEILLSKHAHTRPRPLATNLKGVVVIDSPKVGNRAFSDALCKHITCARILHEGDTTHKYPLMQAYELSEHEKIAVY